MSELEIFNQTDEEIDELETVKSVLNYAIKKEKLENVIFNVIIVDNNYIHELNRDYRHIDRETDVITFALEDEKDMVVPDGERVLGDIYIAIDVAYEQAEIYGHSRMREVCFLATHGILHLLGYDHMEEDEEKIMFDKQKELLESYEITR